MTVLRGIVTYTLLLAGIPLCALAAIMWLPPVLGSGPLVTFICAAVGITAPVALAYWLNEVASGRWGYRRRIRHRPTS